MARVITLAEALSRLQALCAGREICAYDAEQKLFKWGLSASDRERIVDSLIDDRFIDETRYARSYVNDKFRFDKWGRIKIGYALKMKRLSSVVIDEALLAIDEASYLENLTQLLASKQRTLKSDLSPQELHAKLYRFALTRGFESGLVLSVLKQQSPCDY